MFVEFHVLWKADAFCSISVHLCLYVYGSASLLGRFGGAHFLRTGHAAT